MPDDPNATIFDLLLGNDPQGQARAMAQRLRQQQLVGQMGLAGGRRSQAIGATDLADVKQQQDELAKAGVARLHYGEEAKNRESYLKQSLAQMAAQRAAAHDQALKDIAGIKGQYGLLAAARKAEDDTKQGQLAENDMIRFAEKHNPGLAVRSAVGLSGQNVYRAVASKQLLQGQMVPPQFLDDVAITMARIAGGGGNIGQEMERRLKAKGLKADVAGARSYLLSEPVDVGMRGWTKLITDKLNQEIKVAGDFARNAALKDLPTQVRAAKYRPELLENYLLTNGLADYVRQDNPLTPVAPGDLAGRVGRADIAKHKAKLQPGERLVFDPEGQPHAAGPDDKLPEGYWEAP